MSAQPNPTDSYKGRRTFFGLNVAVVVVMAAGIVVALNFLSIRFLSKMDWTSTAVNSLSPRTLQVINFLSQPVKLTAVYGVTEGSERPADKLAARRRDRLMALLQLYERANPGKVTIEGINRQTEQTKLEKLGKRLNDRLTTEAKGHVEVIQAYHKWLLEAQKVLLDEMAGLKKALDVNKDVLGKNESFKILASELSGQLRAIGLQLDQFKTLTSGTVWPYGQLADLAREGYQTMQGMLTELPRFYLDNLTGLPNLNEETKKWFASADQRFKPLLDGLSERLHAVDDLKPLKTEEVRQQLAAGDAVVIEMGEDNWVVPESSLWVLAPQARHMEDRSEADFAGEAEITSALVRMSLKNKPVVMFVRHGGPPAVTPDPAAMMMMQMGQPPQEPEYSQLRLRLVREGFEVLEWNVADAPQPPPTPNAPRQIYVVLPPRIANPSPMAQAQQPPRPIGGPQIAAVRQALETSGRMLVFSGFEPPMPAYPGGPPMPQPYKYELLMKDLLGLKLNTDGLVVTAVPGNVNDPETRGKLMLNPSSSFALFQYDLQPFPITRGLEGANMVFALPAWITPFAGSQPASQPAWTVENLVLSRNEPNVWACVNPLNLIEKYRENPLKGLKPESEDITQPVALAAAVTYGPEKKNKAVVVACSDFATDQMANKAEPQFYGSRLVFVPTFPGNMEFTVNAIHWLNDSDKTAIPPAAGAMARVNITPEASTTWKVILGGVWPGLVLLCGVFAWWVRRK